MARTPAPAPSDSGPVDLAIVGCGNLVRGDDGVGPQLIRRLWDLRVPAGVRLIDGGTAGMDVAFQLKGARRAIIVDACQTGAAPGTVFEVPRDQIDSPAQPASRNAHSFRWDNALAFGRWLLGDGMPRDISVYLIEAKQTDVDAPLSPEVREGMEQVATHIAAEWRRLKRATDAVEPIPRPQPLGVFPLPAGYLLIPGVSKLATSIRADLTHGRLPASWPKYLEGQRLAYAGDADGARAHFAARAGRSLVDRFNLFVLDPDQVDAEQLRRDMGRLAPLVDLVAFTLGDAEEPPELGTTEGEIAALILSAQVSAWSQAAPSQSLQLLGQAIAAAEEPSPALQALLRVARADLLMAQGQDEANRREALSDLELADAMLRETDLGVARAEVMLATAMVYQQGAAENAGMGQLAISKYHEALAVIDRAVSPELFATAHVNLAACYLTMPMAYTSDALRYAVAVQSLRAALEVFTPEDYPQQWESAQLNLANALLYAPTLRQRENHVEAVELYQAVIEARRESDDVLGYARALANQGTALAQLGALDRAEQRLTEAIAVFDRLGRSAEAQSVGAVLAEVRQVAGGAR